MKLLHCLDCGDILRLYSEWRFCKCSKSMGKYVNDTHVTLRGNSRAIGIDTREILHDVSGTWAESERVIK